MYSLYAQILSLPKIFGTAFCVRFRRLAVFYSKSFLLGTLYEIVVHICGEHIKVLCLYLLDYIPMYRRIGDRAPPLDLFLAR